MPDVSNLRDDGTLQPSFDHVAIVGGDRVEQPGTLYHTDTVVPQHIYRDRKAMHADAVQDRASTKSTVRAFTAPDLNAHPLLFADPHRKKALITVCNGSGILVGTEASVSNIAGSQAATKNATLLAAQGVWFVPNALQAIAGVPLEYTSQAPLWYCVATTADVGAAYIQCLIEMFDSGVPVT